MAALSIWPFLRPTCPATVTLSSVCATFHCPVQRMKMPVRLCLHSLPFILSLAARTATNASGAKLWSSAFPFRAPHCSSFVACSVQDYSHVARHIGLLLLRTCELLVYFKFCLVEACCSIFYPYLAHVWTETKCSSRCYQFPTKPQRRFNLKNKS